jgi:hypothetical protein
MRFRIWGIGFKRSFTTVPSSYFPDLGMGNRRARLTAGLPVLLGRVPPPH